MGTFLNEMYDLCNSVLWNRTNHTHTSFVISLLFLLLFWHYLYCQSSVIFCY